jgi:hypothetical protein
VGRCFPEPAPGSGVSQARARTPARGRVAVAARGAPRTPAAGTLGCAGSEYAVGCASSGTGSGVAGAGGGVTTSGPAGVSGPAACVSEACRGSTRGAAAAPHAKLWNPSDVVSGTGVSTSVDVNGAGVSSCATGCSAVGASRASRRQRDPSNPKTTSSSSSQACSALCVRSAGSFTSRRSIHSDTPRSIDGLTLCADGICSLTWRRMIATGVSVSSNGACPTKNS